MRKKQTSGENIYKKYTILFSIFFVCVFSVFSIYGKSYLWSSDGMGQHYPSAAYSHKWIVDIVKNFFKTGKLHVALWDFCLGFGQDVFGNAINFRPMNFLMCLFPSAQIEAFLFVRTILSLYLVGIAFIAFAKTKTNDQDALLIGSMIYTFCGFSLYFAARHTFFCEMMFYLPLMLMGVDRILEKKKSWIFIWMVFFSVSSYFYFLYMVTIPAVIYAVFRYFEVREKEQQSVADFFRTILIFAVHYLIALMLGMFSLLPSLIRTLQSSRTSVQTGMNYFIHETSYYLEFVRGVIDTTEIGIYGHMAFSGIAVFCLLYMIFKKHKDRRLYLGQMAVYTLVYLIPLLAMVFSGFAGNTQRWCFIYAFWISMIVVEMLPEFCKKDVPVMLKSSLCTVGYLVVYLLVVRVQRSEIGSGVIWLVVYLLILMVINLTSFFEQKRRLLSVCLLLVLCAETTMKSYELFGTDGEGYIKSYHDSGKVIEVGRDNAASARYMVDDDSVYRIDAVQGNLSKKYQQVNYGFRDRVPGLSSYYSFSSGWISDYSVGLGNSQQNISFLILDLDQRTVLNELAAVKYVATTEERSDRVPYGYKLVRSNVKTYSDGHTENQYLYENEYALPLMYVYDSCISESDYEEMQTYEKEQAMLQGLVLEDDVQQELDYKKSDVKFDYTVLMDQDEILQQLKENAEKNDSIEVYDDHFEVTKNNASISLNVDQEETGEIYWVMNNVRYDSVNLMEKELEALGEDATTYAKQLIREKYNGWSETKSALITVTMGKLYDTCPLLNKTNQYYFGERDFLMNLGYAKSDSLKLTFNRAGVYYFKDLQLVCQPMDEYEDRVAELKKTPVSEISLAGNSIRGVVTADDKKMVCIAVPYATGWSAYVNGKKADVYRANGMYMAVQVEAGENEIILKYRTSGLIAGIAVSTVTVCVLVALWYVCDGPGKKRKQRKKGKQEKE